jgi:hypothetical protein
MGIKYFLFELIKMAQIGQSRLFSLKEGLTSMKSNVKKTGQTEEFIPKKELFNE